MTSKKRVFCFKNQCETCAKTISATNFTLGAVVRKAHRMLFSMSSRNSFVFICRIYESHNLRIVSKMPFELIFKRWEINFFQWIKTASKHCNAMKCFERIHKWSNDSFVGKCQKNRLTVESNEFYIVCPKVRVWLWVQEKPSLQILVQRNNPLHFLLTTITRRCDAKAFDDWNLFWHLNSKFLI